VAVALLKGASSFNNATFIVEWLLINAFSDAENDGTLFFEAGKYFSKRLVVYVGSSRDIMLIALSS